MTPLHIALATEADDQLIRQLLYYGGDLSIRSHGGRTPLHTFYNKSIRFLLDSFREDIELTIKDKTGMSILHYLSWSSKTQVSTVKRYAAQAKGAFGDTDFLGRTVLHLAAGRGNTALFKHFVETGHNLIPKPDFDGQSLLHYAVQSKRTEMIDLVIELGIDMDGMDKRGLSALYHAIERDNVAALGRIVELVGSHTIPFEALIEHAKSYEADAAVVFLMERKARTTLEARVPPGDIQSWILGSGPYRNRTERTFLCKETGLFEFLRYRNTTIWGVCIVIVVLAVSWQSILLLTYVIAIVYGLCLISRFYTAE